MQPSLLTFLSFPPNAAPVMKRIEVLIPHERIQNAERALSQSGIEGLTLTSVYMQCNSVSSFSAGKNRLMGKPCCKVDLLVSDDDLPAVQKALVQIGHPDLRLQIFVMDLETTIRIRTGECEEAALR
ncbi:MAG: hypothetical protein KDA84_20180 [Planctomycetaceae bacterium]|nr:hypothetical protein [Planctomycetaceae bacterium]